MKVGDRVQGHGMGVPEQWARVGVVDKIVMYPDGMWIDWHNSVAQFHCPVWMVTTDLVPFYGE